MWRLRLRRWNRRRRGHIDPELSYFWDAGLPAYGADWRDVGFLVCDAEMSGLDVSDAELLSLGWVAIEAGEVVLATAEHRLIRNQRSVGHSATIHQLRDCELDQAESTREVMLAFLHAAQQRVLVFHHAALDLAFLDRACRSQFGGPLLAPIADTLVLEQRRLARADKVPAKGALRLQACRDRVGLAPHRAHNALTDAIATAELFLAQVAERGDRVLLRDLLRG